MRRLVVVVAVLASSTARADGGDDASAYCTLTRALAASESALLLSPQLFLDSGIVNANDAASSSGGASASSPVERLTFGLRYSFGNLYRGVVDRQRADADCRRQRAASGLGHFLVENREQASPAALDAKLAVLRSALPRALETTRALRNAVERGHANLEELQACEARLDELEAELAAAEVSRGGVPSSRSVDLPPDELLAQHRRADAEVATYESRLRQSRALDVALRGGYDRFFSARDDLPLFVALNVTINPGWLFQLGPEREAAAARARFVRSEADGLEQKAELLQARLRAALAAEKRRLGDVGALVADLEGRLRTLESIESERLKRFREASWFEWVRLKAEQEFLRVHTVELARTLGEEDG